jgi:hypothetical protein
MIALNRLRLRNQWLTGTRPRTPLDVVTHFCAMQSQEFGPATWAIGVRAKGLARADVVRAYDAGEIVRTHVLRPTWHFVAPADVRWMLALTAPRLRPLARAAQAKLGLTLDVAARSRRSIERALAEGAPLTRAELAQRMRMEGLRVEGQAGYHLTFDAELEGLICSGPMRGRHFTYALLEKRVAPVAPIERDEALATLARRYFASHGPATERDFAWWSGLTMGDVRRGIAILGDALERIDIDGTAYVAAPSRMPPARRAPIAHLLPCFDELTVAHVDRRATAGSSAPKGEPPGALLVDLVIVDGVRVGTWKRTTGSTSPAEITLMRRLARAERAAVDRALGRYRRFVAGSCA